MKNKIFILFLLPCLLFAHIRDERLFKTVSVPPSALLLLDRSGSMASETIHWETIVRLNDYRWFDWRTALEGWYDTDIFPDGPGMMSDFSGDSASGNWVLYVQWYDFWSSRCDLSWTLKIKTGGSWHTFDGGSHSWTGNGWEERQLIIHISGLEIVEDVECYVDVSTGWGLKIGGMRITLVKTPSIYPYKSTRIKDALIVIHSLLDADNDGFVTEADDDDLPVKLGYGFFHEASHTVPGDYSYVYNESFYKSGWRNRFETYNQNQYKWEDASSGPLETDSLGSHFIDIWDHINFTCYGGMTVGGQLIAQAKDYINSWRNKYPELWCMKHNIVFIADGESNTGTMCGSWTDEVYPYDNKGAHEVVSVAYDAWHNDSIRVYAVGFGEGITDEGANQLNWIARWGGTQKEDSAFIDSMITYEGMDTMAVDGSMGCSMADPDKKFLTGYAYIAKNAMDLSSALLRIFIQISGQQDFSYAAGEVTSVEEEFLSTEYQARLYFASFIPESEPIWKGNLKAVKLEVGEFDLAHIPPEIIIWSARDSLEVDKSATERNIYGIKSNGDMLPFNTANFDSSDLDVSSSWQVTDVIDRIRDGLEDDDRGELGDIFHSSPIRIHLPNYFYLDQGFGQFYQSMKNRSAILYAGANDGMLHIFTDSINGEVGRGGEEIMGIIPMNFVPEVQCLLDEHGYFVDADPVAADIWFPTDGNDSLKQLDEWHTVLIACQGEGGRSFTALDVTDPLGETSHPMNSIAFLFSGMQSSLLQDTLGFTTSTPAIHKVGINWIGHPNRTIDRFYAFMGGGQWPEPMDIFLLDSVFSGGEVEGNVIIGFDVWKVIEEGINGNVHLITPIGRDATKMVAPFPATPAMINIDPEKGSRYDCLFIPDAYGQLWFVDLRNPDPTAWEAECIFVPPLPASSDSSELSNWHPAFFRPLVWKDPVYGDYWVAYGTGNRSDIFIPSEDRFYALRYPNSAIEDTSIAIPVYVEGDLGEPGNPTGAGWKLTLQHTDEKVVTQAIYYLDSLKFFTFTPGEGYTESPCEIGGTNSIARSYVFDIRTGGTSMIGGTVEGSGMPQPPRYSYSLGGTGMEITQVVGKIKIKEIKGFKSYKEIVKWKEE